MSKLDVRTEGYPGKEGPAGQKMKVEGVIVSN